MYIVERGEAGHGCDAAYEPGRSAHPRRHRRRAAVLREGCPAQTSVTGGENYHGRFEFVPVEDMEKCVRMLVEILTA